MRASAGITSCLSARPRPGRDPKPHAKRRDTQHQDTILPRCVCAVQWGPHQAKAKGGETSGGGFQRAANRRAGRAPGARQGGRDQLSTVSGLDADKRRQPGEKGGKVGRERGAADAKGAQN